MNNSDSNYTGYPDLDRTWTVFYTEKHDPSVPALSIYDFLLECIQEHKDSTAITFFGKEISFGDFIEKIENAAEVLTFLGVKEGDRILYLLPNIPEAAFFLYAGAKLGAIADYVDPRAEGSDPSVSASKILSVVDREKIAHIVLLDVLYPYMIAPIEEALLQRELRSVMTVSLLDSLERTEKKEYFKETLELYGLRFLIRKVRMSLTAQAKAAGAGRKTAMRIYRYSELKDRTYPTKAKPWVFKDHSIAVIVHTSGTSGTFPKPIPLTHENLNMHVKSLMVMEPRFKNCTKHLMLLPFFAAFGIATNGHMVWCNCTNQVMIPDFSPEKIADLITYHKINSLCLLPSWCSMFRNTVKAGKTDFSTLSVIIYGGDNMAAWEEEAINKILADNGSPVKLSKGHGMSETCGAASYGNESFCEPGSMGIPCPYVTYAILSPSDMSLIKFKESDEFIEGLAAISGPTITPGILDGVKIVDFIRIHGADYILTGDIVRMDKKGRMTFLSRESRSFTRYDGYKIKPYEIENMLMKSPDIASCVIAPYMAPNRAGNMPRAFIVMKNGGPKNRREAVRIVKNITDTMFLNNKETVSRQIPSSFRFVQELPVTENGKINYKMLEYAEPENDDVQVIFDETAMSVGRLTVI